MAESIPVCAVCDSSEFGGLDKQTTIKKVGLMNFTNCSKERNDDKWLKWVNCDQIVVHESCRLSYIAKQNVSAAKKRKLSGDSPSSTTSASASFKFSSLCLICGTLCDKKIEGKKPKVRRRVIYSITPNSSWKERLLNATQSLDDDLSLQVRERIHSVHDLTEAGAVYHLDCLTEFLRERENKKKDTVNPRNSKFTAQFETLFATLENSEDCQWSLDQIVQIIGDPAPTRKYIKEVLQDRYGDNIIFSSRGRDRTIVTLKGYGHDILMDYFKTNLPAEDDEERKLNVLKLAAQYIREDIRAVDTDVEYYPASTDFLSKDNIEDVVPHSLMLLLKEAILPKKKDVDVAMKRIVTIAHAIITATRPASFISSLQLALSLYIHSKHQSKILVNILYRLGLGASYDETILYEGSAVMSPVPQVQPSEDSFLQFIFDNADYDTRTIDGKNTFHYTGGVECISPASSTELTLNIKRLNSAPSASSIAAKHRIPIVQYDQPDSRGLSLTEIQDIRKLRPLQTNNTFLLPGEILWVTGHWLKVPQHVGWNGFMELRSNSSDYETSKIKFLPFIYLKATDNTTLYSAMIFGLKEAKKIGQKNVFFTFDQQLYIKAREILADVEFNLVECDHDMSHVFIRLGGFHLIMSFLGCIGKVMDASGLREAWATIYADKSTEKMLTGKNYARSLRANFYTEAALLTHILDESDLTDKEKREILNIICMEPSSNELASNNDQTILGKIQTYPVVSILKEKLNDKMNLIAERGKTATLWIQYIKMVSLVRSFIQAERCGDFDLHLSTIIEMIPFFHSSRHFNYAKSAHLYVQDMLELEKKMDSPEEFEKYSKRGFFTIRRSDKFFSGIYTDMIIEQSLMRSIHSIGGLSRGRGLTESVATSWLNTLGCTAYINDDLEDFCRIETVFSEQHKDFRDSLIDRDGRDLKLLVQWFQDHPPFTSRETIISIASGVSGDPTVNCYEAEYLGIKSYETIIPIEQIESDGNIVRKSQNFANVKFSQEYQVIPLSITNGCVTIKNVKHPVDAKILFDRFRRSQPNEADYPKAFEYELSPYPQSMFENMTTMRHSSEDIWSLFKACDEPQNTNRFSVIDGETLLSLVTWPKSCTYQHLYDTYVKFVAQTYGAQCIIIFPSEKNTREHPTESKKLFTAAIKICSEIYFDPLKSITKNQDILFTNNKNKTRFITQLSETLTRYGVKVKRVLNTDEDRLIVDEALNRWEESRDCAIISRNVDILCLLMSTCNPQQNIYFNIPNKGWYCSYSLHQQYQELTPYFFVIHALLGCKTTSSMFKISKKTVVKSFVKEKETIINLLSCFYKPITNDELPVLFHSGEQLIIKMYKGNSNNLNELRCARYINSLKLKRKSDFNLATLPPTTAAATFHILRVYWQVQRWLKNMLPAESWGWDLVNDSVLVPIITRLRPMPEDLLGLISCQCKNKCSPRTCGCIKSGLLCSHLCKNCSESSCPYIPIYSEFENADILNVDGIDDDIVAEDESNVSPENENDELNSMPGPPWRQ